VSTSESALFFFDDGEGDRCHLFFLLFHSPLPRAFFARTHLFASEPFVVATLD